MGTKEYATHHWLCACGHTHIHEHNAILIFCRRVNMLTVYPRSPRSWAREHSEKQRVFLEDTWHPEGTVNLRASHCFIAKWVGFPPEKTGFYLDAVFKYSWEESTVNLAKKLNNVKWPLGGFLQGVLKHQKIADSIPWETCSCPAPPPHTFIIHHLSTVSPTPTLAISALSLGLERI